MSITNLLYKDVQYNTWVAEQLVNWLQTIPEQQLQKEIPSSFTSMAKTLKHINDTQLYWSTLIKDVPVPEFEYMPTHVDVTVELQNLVEEAELLEQYVKEHYVDMQENLLIESQWFTSNFPKYEYLQHLIIHTTYHRGQMITIGHNIQAPKAPMLDFNFWNVITQQNES